MTLLDNHLEQISLSSKAIADLPFPLPKIFTNALLHSHDITALIRDTESHERVLFSVAPPDSDSAAPRRSTIHPSKKTREASLKGFRLARHGKYHSAAAALLGGELGEQLHKEGRKDPQGRGEIDVEILFRGAEKLCAIYPIPGAADKIASMRTRHGQLASSIARFESRVSRQTGQLAKMNRSKSFDDAADEEDHEEHDIHTTSQRTFEQAHISTEDFLREEEEIRDLENKKRALEDRVSGMERDLGGLLR